MHGQSEHHMSKEAIKIGVRLVSRPEPVQQAPNQPYRPPKAQVFKAIATCSIGNKQFSRTSAKPTEEEARSDAYSKLATLIAKQGVVPVPGFGVEVDSSDQT
jgi:hypothetical protein